MNNIGKELNKAIMNGYVDEVETLLGKCDNRKIIANGFNCALGYSGDGGKGDLILEILSRKLASLN